jgi:hypothetical protein
MKTKTIVSKPILSEDLLIQVDAILDMKPFAQEKYERAKEAIKKLKPKLEKLIESNKK